MHGIEIVVHLAALKADEKESRDTNVRGTEVLIAACEEAKVSGFVHMSTMSTTFTRRGVYGDTKAAAEEVVRRSCVPSVILRSSIVYKNAQSGIIGTLMQLTILPIVPVFGPGTETYRPIHVDDLALIVEKIIARPLPHHGYYDVGGPDTVSFNDLIRMVCRELRGKSPLLIHIPIPLGIAMARVLALIMPRPPITVSNMIAFGQNAPVRAEKLYSAYNVRPRTLAQGFKEMKHTVLIPPSEGAALMSYLLRGTQVAPYYVALYEQALTQQGFEDRHISPWILKKRARIAAFDAITKLTRKDGIFQQKIYICAALIEASPLSSESLLPRTRSRFSLGVLLTGSGIRYVFALAHGTILRLTPLYERNA
jgi:NADH dehydrogenase